MPASSSPLFIGQANEPADEKIFVLSTRLVRVIILVNLFEPSQKQVSVFSALKNQNTKNDMLIEALSKRELLRSNFSRFFLFRLVITVVMVQQSFNRRLRFYCHPVCVGLGNMFHFPINLSFLQQMVFFRPWIGLHVCTAYRWLFSKEFFIRLRPQIFARYIIVSGVQFLLLIPLVIFLVSCTRIIGPTWFYESACNEENTFLSSLCWLCNLRLKSCLLQAGYLFSLFSELSASAF